MVFNYVTFQILKEKRGSKLSPSAFSFRIAWRVFTNLHFHFCFTYTLKMEATLFPKHRCPATTLQCPIFHKFLNPVPYCRGKIMSWTDTDRRTVKLIIACCCLLHNIVENYWCWRLFDFNDTSGREISYCE